MPSVTTIDPPTLPSNPLYANITATPTSNTHTLYTISGQIGTDPSTNTTPPGLAAQLPISLHRVKLCLEHIGATTHDIFRLTYYIRQGGIEDYENETVDGQARGKGSAVKLIIGIVGKWLEGAKPASCYVRSFGMTDDKYECEFEAQVVLENGKRERELATAESV
jgi:enamine deaminase RidA (YjgF/YER057c/UK114 family)